MGRFGFLASVGVALAIAVVAGCGADDGAEVEPIEGAGSISVPESPLVLDELPQGWSVFGAELQERSWLDGPMQTLYLPPGSTPEAGPALAIGHFGQEAGSVSCGFGRKLDYGWNGPLPEGVDFGLGFHRAGNRAVVSGEMDTDQPGYVIGRDLTDEQVEAAARATAFPTLDTEHPPPAEIEPAGLPAGFRKVAVAPVVPFAVAGEVVDLRSADGGHWVRIGAYDGDDAGDLLTRFWHAVLPDDPCDHRGNPIARRQIGGTDAFVQSDSSQEFVDRIADRLRATDRDGFERFRRRVDDQPASTMSPCSNPSGSVYVEGTDGNLRWVLAMPADTTGFGMSCYTFFVDREWAGGGSGGGSPDGFALGPGSHDIQVLGGVTDGGVLRDGEFHGVKHLSGGTVPASAERVVITLNGTSTDAVLVDGGTDPGRRYFGALLRPEPDAQAWYRPTIVAYDARGREVARANPVPDQP